MAYLGENRLFSYRDNFCEPIAGTTVSSSSAADFGRLASTVFSRFSVGCPDESCRYLLYSLCSGIAECGRDVFICEGDDLPSFRYGLSITGSDCGIYISGKNGVRFSFFGKNGFPMTSGEMVKLMSAADEHSGNLSGKMITSMPLRSIYINNIRDAAGDAELPLSAGISCGAKKIRTLWQEFFSDSDDTLILQISDDGQRVNAYSTELGFISYDRLCLAYAMTLWESGQAAALPEKFHYAAENIASSRGFELISFDPDSHIPGLAVKQRFLADPLFMCTQLLSDRAQLFAILREIPNFSSARRDIPLSSSLKIPCGRAILEPNGRVYITKSGKNRVSLVAQAYDSETAAELCSAWDEKLRRLSSCTNIFHSEG